MYDAFVLQQIEEDASLPHISELDDVFAKVEGEGVAPLDKVAKYIERLGGSKKESKSGKGHGFFNGRYLPMDDVSSRL